jgi:hypothetical protein
MTRLQIRVGLAALVLMGVTGAVSAGPVERACVASVRAKGNSSLCGCVQKVADVTLSGADQVMVAQFFLNPDKAEEVRMKSTVSANAFWDRYTVFGEQAQMACKR